ncbi:hypothetical protein VB319_25360 [Vibrio parahaemolyticus]|uniref:hypothetical protein n=1 Tax=Vibrio parahaemolyticus TaxID=670 RepID=UPI002B20CF29|nr:hypothetical protein [Vibrio parahaemolyticus]MEA5357259.1 hypothetical protein [Vibrio parahaemolyticus]
MNSTASKFSKFQAFKSSVKKVTDSTSKELKATFFYSVVTASLFIIPLTILTFWITELDSRAELIIGLVSFCFLVLSTVKIHSKVASKIMERNEMQLREIISGFSKTELAFFYNQDINECSMNSSVLDMIRVYVSNKRFD